MLKKILFTLALAVAILALVSFFLPSKIHVSRSTVINVKPETAFAQVNNLKIWKNWSYWDQLDPEMQSVYEGPESGAGAMHSWKSDHRMVGEGSMTIVESTEPSIIITSLNFGGTTSLGGWTFEEFDSGTQATVYMDLELSFVSRIFPGLMMNEWLGNDFDKTLAGLKSWCESLPVAPEEKEVWTVETINTTATDALSIQITTNQENFTSKLNEAYIQLNDAISKQGLRQSGPNYAIYYQWSKDTVSFEAGIPVDNKGKTEGNINAVSIPSVKAVKVDYYGESAGTEKVHYFIDEYVKENGITITGAPWEEYVTDPSAEPDTSKWLTRVYYPVN
jgi:effector-binding domain-containing protein